MSKRIKVFFTLSVVLNMLLAGMLLGDVSRYIWPDALHRPPAELLAQLPEAKRKLFEESMKKLEQDMAGLHAQFVDAKKEATRVLKAEPFNKQAYLTQMQHVSDLRARVKRRTAETVAEIAGQFTPAERAVLADLVSRPSADAATIHTEENKH